MAQILFAAHVEADDPKQACAHSLMHDITPLEFLVEDEKAVTELVELTEEDAAEARVLALEGKLFPTIEF
ncbi:hypothetical protein [Mesorhizobium sp. ES1-3]|uniref:hypothetical protein n=1 Tax=Mesorhizobium sp. ES1-3 TaxID=2876628 RepID=UPI001CCEDB86|nr:hypothetical protein [Mesorhizobium sp. ES1-3]MBZ9673310.1 hypothetical protein [Mesorhizobium sp. ES1-3]